MKFLGNLQIRIAYSVLNRPAIDRERKIEYWNEKLPGLIKRAEDSLNECPGPGVAWRLTQLIRPNKDGIDEQLIVQPVRVELEIDLPPNLDQYEEAYHVSQVIGALRGVGGLVAMYAHDPTCYASWHDVLIECPRRESAIEAASEPVSLLHGEAV